MTDAFTAHEPQALDRRAMRKIKMAKPRNETTLLDRSSQFTTKTIAGAAYEAAISGEGWQGILDDLRHALRARAIAMIEYHSPARGGGIRQSAGLPAQFAETYKRAFATQDVWMKRLDCSGAMLHAARGEDLVAEHLLVGSDFYRHWLEPQGLFHSMIIPLMRREETYIVCMVMRSESDGRFDDDAMAHLTGESAHLGRALEIHDILSRTATERDAALSALDQVRVGVIIVDDQGMVSDSNHVANEILAANDGLTVDRSGLKALTREATSALYELIAHAFRPDGNVDPAATDTISLERRSGGSELALTVGRLPISGRFLGTDRRTAAIYITDPDKPFELDAAKLRLIYKLTPAEARLAALLAQGRRLEDAAADLAVSLNTVRTHLKRIFSKTGTDRQAELVRLILSGPASIATTRGA